MYARRKPDSESENRLLNVVKILIIEIIVWDIPRDSSS